MRNIWITILLAGALPLTSAHGQEAEPATGVTTDADRSAERNTRLERRKQGQSVNRAESGPGVRPARIERAQPLEGSIDVDRANRIHRGSRSEGTVRTARDEPIVQPVETTDPVPMMIEQRATSPHNPADVSRRSGRNIVERRSGRGDGNLRANDHDWRNGNGDWRDGRADAHRRDKDRDWRRDADNHRDWSRDWRRDRRYDWWDYRNNHQAIFQLGRYYDPYGWGYRRFTLGYSLRPFYYKSSYWLDDPWMYRLPPAYGSYRWVRYYDDALLVNIHTGFVADVIHNFFW